MYSVNDEALQDCIGGGVKSSVDFDGDCSQVAGLGQFDFEEAFRAFRVFTEIAPVQATDQVVVSWEVSAAEQCS